MKFKVIKGTETDKKLLELKSNMEKCNKAAGAFVKSVGGEKHCSEQNKLYGGVAAVQFESKPADWKMVGAKWQRLYYPKSIPKNKQLFEELRNLPTLEYDDLNSIVNFTSPGCVVIGDGLAWVHTVGLKWGKKETALITIHDGIEYTPNKDMVEILESEYNKLLKDEE